MICKQTLPLSRPFSNLKLYYDPAVSAPCSSCQMSLCIWSAPLQQHCSSSEHCEIFRCKMTWMRRHNTASSYFPATDTAQLPCLCLSNHLAHSAALEGAGLMQVSHHPPVGAAHAENKDWEYDMVSAPTTKFLGNSIDIYPIGRFLPCTPSALSPTPCYHAALLRRSLSQIHTI